MKSVVVILHSIFAAFCGIGVSVTGYPRPAVLIGDSIMAGVPVSCLDVNQAVSGSYTADIAERMSQVPTEIRAIYIEGGINDVLSGRESQIIENYKRILANRPPDAKPYLIGILPIDEAALRDDWKTLVSNQKIASLNAEIAALCPDCVRLRITFPPKSHLDGVHLTPIGYAALTAAIEFSQ
jgi:lysophospholipase L1-like esterase